MPKIAKTHLKKYAESRHFKHFRLLKSVYEKSKQLTCRPGRAHGHQCNSSVLYSGPVTRDESQSFPQRLQALGQDSLAVLGAAGSVARAPRQDLPQWHRQVHPSAGARFHYQTAQGRNISLKQSYPKELTFWHYLQNCSK